MLAAAAQAVGQIAGGVISNYYNQQQQRRNEANQREFAQHGVQWKVEDAKRAGIHPIYALGAPTHSFAPQSVGDSLGPAIANAGQYIGRAVNSTSSDPTRATAFTQAAQTLALEKGALENELLRSNISRMRQQQNPPMPTPDQRWGVDGQAESGVAIKEKRERQNWDPSNPSGEAFAIPDLGYSRTPAGGYMPIPSKDIKERIEDIEPAEWAWFARNNLPQAVGLRYAPPFKAPQGQEWTYSVVDGYTLRSDASPYSDRPDERRLWGKSRWLGGR